MTRAIVAGVLAAVALVGVAGATVVQGPVGGLTTAEVQRYCSVEEQGARALSANLQRRSRELDAREQSIGARSSELAAAEARLRTRLDEIDAARKAAEQAESALAAKLAEAEAARTGKVVALVQMVEASKPDRVAPMFRELDPKLAVEVLDGMQRTKAGKLLATLPASHAAGLAERMATPIRVPTP